MSSTRLLVSILLAVASAGALAGGASPMLAQAARNRAEESMPIRDIASALQETRELLKARKHKEVLATLRELDRVADRTPRDVFEIEQLRAAAATAAGELPVAVKAYEVVIASVHLSPADRLPTMRTLVGLHHQSRDHARVILWASRYLKEGGADPQVGAWLSQAYVDSGDYANAARELQRAVQASERAGQTPSEEQLLLLQKCYVQLGDASAVVWVLEKLVTHHRHKRYWSELLDRVQNRPDFGERLALDVLRLRWLTGTLRAADDYVQMTTLALQAGFPSEAAKVVEQGFANGSLGKGPQADRHRALRAQAARQQTEMQQTLARPDAAAAAAAARDGIWLVNLGFTYVTQGDFAKGISLMEQGIQKGGLIDKPQDAKLRLGIAYLLAGQKGKAIDTLKNVGGIHGAADLGRMWSIYARTAAI